MEWLENLRRQIAEWAGENGGESNPIVEALQGFVSFLAQFFSPNNEDAPTEETDPSAPSPIPESPLQIARLGRLIVEARALPIWASFQQSQGEGRVRHMFPVAGQTRQTGDFHEQRSGHQHAGIDLAATAGTPVLASADGVVLFAGNKQGYGQCVIIGHADGTFSLYGHMRQGSIDHIEIGSTVSQGVQIGEVGNTGRSTGPHLHYEQRNRRGQEFQPVIDRSIQPEVQRAAVAAFSLSSVSYSPEARYLDVPDVRDPSLRLGPLRT